MTQKKKPSKKKSKKKKTSSVKKTDPVERESGKQPGKKRSPANKKKREASSTSEQAKPNANENGDKSESTKRAECVVVGIGASAGGLEAYKRLLSNLPADGGLAYVLVQHLDPTHESLMVELLSKYTSMPVQQIENATPILPNHVYMIPPKHFVKIKDNGLFLDEPITNRGMRLPIDYFFNSLAQAREERAICVVLSGTGSDGAAGVREVKAAGGLTIAQKPESAEYDGMPRAAISTGSIDFVLPIADMTDVIVPYASHPYVQTSNVTLADSAPDHFRAIISLLRAHTDQDFSRYKKGTLTRRIDRRMSIRQISNPSDYLKLLRSDNDELRALFKDLLIGVTRFFRDKKSWDDLSDTLTPIILDKREEEPFRVWVPGCSTGEEAYTVAMLMFALQQRQNKRLDVQIFATDIDSDAIDAARLGCYPENSIKDLSGNLVDSFFQMEGNRLCVRKKLRETCIFAVQNLLSDPPFSNLDLICCRNLLIYLEADVQKKIFDMLHFALKPNGLLMLGSSESPSKRKQLFDTVSQSARIYRKVGTSRPGAGGVAMPASSRKPSDGRNEEDSARTPAMLAGTVELSKRALLDQFAPASVVVNYRGQIQYIHGPIRNYLDFPIGEPELQISAMAQPGLKAKTRSALQQAKATGETVSVLAPRVQRDSSHVSVRVRAYPLPSTKNSDPLYLISFLDEAPQSEAEPEQSEGKSGDGSDANDSTREKRAGIVEDAAERNLALELQATREDLQSTIEELESANEELKASNEEVMSMNEELQSTNEELETSREELQSLNEELSTVNNQLHDKVEELELTNNDLSNLLTSTEMATLFLDDDLCIRRFTPATSRLMNVLPTDVGRPISDLSGRVNDPGLLEDAREVLDRLTPIETEVQNGGGHWYMRRVMPFRTADNKIEGVVVTFSDITSVKEGASRLEFRERQQAIVAQLGRSALGGEKLHNLFDMASKAVSTNLNSDLAKVLQLESDKKTLRLVAGVGWDEGVVGDAVVRAGINSQAGYTLQTAAPVLVENLAKEKRFSGPPLLTDHDVVGGISVLIGPENDPWGIFGVHSREPRTFTLDDANFVSAIANVLWLAIRREAIETKLRDNEARTASFLNNSAVVAWMKDEEGRYIYASENAKHFLRMMDDEWYGKTDHHFWPAEVADRIAENDQQVLESQQPIEIDEVVLDSDGRRVNFLNQKFPLTDSKGQRFVGGLGVNITGRVRAERALAESEERLRAAARLARFGTYYRDLRTGSLTWSPELKSLIGLNPDDPVDYKVGEIPDFVHEDDRERVAEKVRASLDPSGDGRFDEEYRIRRSDGTVIWVMAQGRTVFEGEGDGRVATRLAGIMLDSTEKHRTTEALEIARQKAEAASEAKSTFLATMSHEIRTPMTAILGYADVLGGRIDDPEMLACVRTIKENGHYLREILNDILDLSRVESGRIPVNISTVSLVEVMADVRSLMDVRAKEKGLDLSVEFDGDIPETVQTDPRLLRQILVNLVGNAIKFTETGGVRVTAMCSKKDEKCRIIVSDTGIGIRSADLEKIFTPFEQLDASFTRSRSGSGLGLAISSKLAALLGGDVSVESEFGRGSQFSFAIEIGSSDGVDWTTPNPSLLRRTRSDEEEPLPTISGRVLAVDDQPEIRTLLREFIRSAGGTIDTAENGEEAIRALARSQQDSTPYDAILMDIHMPEMDGLAAAAQLRAKGYEKSIIALTAHVLQTDRDKFIDAGFDEWLGKPIDRAELLRTLKIALDSAAAAGVRVLLVDDDEATCFSIQTLLERRGYAVRTALNGKEALRAVEDFQPDVAFLDLTLPKMSGADLLKQLKAKPELENCTFVCVSGHASSSVDWREQGFADYLQKPIEADDLAEVIRQVMTKGV